MVADTLSLPVENTEVAMEVRREAVGVWTGEKPQTKRKSGIPTGVVQIPVSPARVRTAAHPAEKGSH